MSTYDSYETIETPRRHRSHRHHHHHRDDRDEPRYVETSETYRGPVIVDEPDYVPSRQDLTLRGREDSDLSVEEVRRDFPPPGGYDQHRMVVRDERYSAPVRSRSVGRSSHHGSSAYLDDPRRSERDLDKGRLGVETKGISRHRSLSRNEKIIAAVGGAALAVGGKEFWDYRQSKEHGGERKERNILATAAVGAAGAFAGYEGAEIYTKKFGDKKNKTKDRETKYKERHLVTYDRDGRVIEEYSEEEEKPKKSRRKSIMEGAMGLAGLGAAAKAMGGGHDDDRSDRRSRRGSDSSHGSRKSRNDRGRGKSPEGIAKFQQAAKAALLAGAAEAFRVRNEPGDWAGAKGKRILTAAIGAGGVGAAAAGSDPDHKSKRHLLEAVVGGLAGNRLLNGSRNNIDEDDDGRSKHGGRSRSRSRAPSHSGGLPFAALATAGLGALAAKKTHDHHSRSRSRADRRRSDSEDSRDDRRHKRSKSVTDYARKGLAALGLGEAADDRRDSRRDRDMDDTRSRRDRDMDDDTRSHRDRDMDDDTRSRRTRRRKDSRDLDSSDDEYDRHKRDDYDDRRREKGSGGRNRRVAEGKQNISDSDSLGSSSDDNKRIKKMKGKQFLTAGLATVATIHAAHNVYQSVQRRKAGNKAVLEGDMSPEEARKQKTKARLQDAASIGIAALGIKGAVSEWKETKEKRSEYLKLSSENKDRHQKRIDRQNKKSIKGGDESDDTRQSRSGSKKESIQDKSTSVLPYEDPQYSQQPLYYDDDPYRPYAEDLPRPPKGYGYAEDLPPPPKGYVYAEDLPPPPKGYGYDRR